MGFTGVWSSIVQRIGRDDLFERDLYALDLSGCDDLPPLDIGTRFVCLLAWDARDATADQVAAVATWLLNAGVTYVCVWGPGCERVHDVIDEESAHRAAILNKDAFVMTTWHVDEQLPEAIYYALACAVPDEAHIHDCHATIGISIGAVDWGQQIREAFTDARGFMQQHLTRNS